MALPTVVKIQLYCPRAVEQQLRTAMATAGAGNDGAYSHCAFVSYGSGYFMPLGGSNPTIGQHHQLQQVDECKIETICTVDALPTVLAAIRSHHPYEQPAIDILPLLNDEYMGDANS